MFFSICWHFLKIAELSGCHDTYFKVFYACSFGCLAGTKNISNDSVHMPSNHFQKSDIGKKGDIYVKLTGASVKDRTLV